MATVPGDVFRNRKHPAASLPPIFYSLTSFEFIRPGITVCLFCFDSSRISASIRSMDIGVELSDSPKCCRRPAGFNISLSCSYS